ncbi:MAG: DUF2851 family protein [Chlorobiota bacterium]
MQEVPERHLQEAVHRLLSDPARVWQTLGRKRLQVLAPGELNVHEGPDFRDMVLLLDDLICVGDGEFHRSQQEWELHGHSADPLYSRVILHILTTPPTTVPQGPPEILVIPESVLLPFLQRTSTEPAATPELLLSMQELQYFALLRLLRHTATARQYMQRLGFQAGALAFAQDFLQRYLQKRRRPVHTVTTIAALSQALPTSGIAQLLTDFHRRAPLNLTLRLQELSRQRIANEGTHLRMELLLNACLPCLLAHANPEQRIELLAWYWSAPSRVRYGHLQRRFPHLPQRYMWQQQGMLEWLRQRGSGMLCRELLAAYRFGDILEFYRTAELLLG